MILIWKSWGTKMRELNYWHIIKMKIYIKWMQEWIISAARPVGHQNVRDERNVTPRDKVLKIVQGQNRVSLFMVLWSSMETTCIYSMDSTNNIVFTVCSPYSTTWSSWVWQKCTSSLPSIHFARTNNHLQLLHLSFNLLPTNFIITT